MSKPKQKEIPGVRGVSGRVVASLERAEIGSAMQLIHTPADVLSAAGVGLHGFRELWNWSRGRLVNGLDREPEPSNPCGSAADAAPTDELTEPA